MQFMEVFGFIPTYRTFTIVSYTLFDTDLRNDYQVLWNTCPHFKKYKF